MESASRTRLPRNNSRGRRSREEILQAAMRVMAERGFEATSLSALREATNLPSSSIYHHFGSKANLLAEVIAWGAKHYQADLDVISDDLTHDGPRELLHHRLLADTCIHQRHEDFFRMVMQLMMNNDIPEAAAASAKVRAEGRARVRSYVAEAFALVRPQDADNLADEFADFALASVEGIMFIGGRPQQEISRLLDQLADAIISLGLAYEPSAEISDAASA